MKQLLYFLCVVIVIISCNNGNSSKSKTEKDAVESTEEDNSANAVAEPEASYKTLRNLIENKQPIPGNYLVTDPENPIRGMLFEHNVLKESDNYILVRSRDDGTAVSGYYLLSFSKQTGKLISFIELGKEAEGVEPYKINWESDNLFSTVNYEYELVEDEESGAYMKGAVLDSIVQKYEVISNGSITSRD